MFYPTQKLVLAVKRSLWMMLVISCVLIPIFTGLVSLTDNLDWAGNLSFGLRVGLLLGMIFGFLFYGGVEIVKHFALRATLSLHGIAPWHYTQFLEASKQAGILKPQEGGYAFRHDWFQTYFRARK